MNQDGQNISNISNSDEESNFLNELDFEKIFSVLKKSIPWIVIIFLLTFTAAFLYLRYTPPIYQSQSTLKLNIKKEADVLNLSGGSKEQDLNNLSGEIELIKSNYLMDRVIRKMDLNVSYYSYGNIMDSERYKNCPFKVEYEIYNPSLYNVEIDLSIISNREFKLNYPIGSENFKNTYHFGQPIKNKDFKLLITLTPSYSSGDNSHNFYFKINSENALISYIASNMNAEILNMYANTISISFKDHDKFKAHDFVSAIDSVYLKLTLEEKNKANKQKINFLDTLLGQTENKLERFENYFEDFIKKNKTSDIPSDIVKTVEKIEELNIEKKKIIAGVSLLKNVEDQLLSGKDSAISIPVSGEIIDPQLFELVKELNAITTKTEKMAFSNKPTTGAYRMKARELGILRGSIIKRLDENVDFLNKDLHSLINKINDLENVFLNLPSKGTEYTKKQRQYKVYEGYFQTMMEKKMELGIEEAGTIPEFQVLSPPSVPSEQIFPEKLVVYGIGLGIGFFLGIALVAIRYLLHNTINNIKDVEKYTQAPILGVIPYYSKEKMIVSRLIVDRNPKSAISEALRSIRTNMEFLIPNKKKKIISVTSTVSGEGKTFVAVNLGGVIALSQYKVILIDLDMRKPKINLAFGHENLEGMSTILIGKHLIDDCIRKTPLKNLDYISAGPTPPNPSELILSEEFDQVLNYLHSIYDVIILDTPPVGLVTDGILVMRKADLPIYIVRSDYSKRDFIKSLNRLIKENKFSKISVILNSVKYTRNNYYDYGYGSGYYDDEALPTSRFPKIRELINAKK